MDKFIKIQEKKFEGALDEIRKGRKVSHWIWYIFPQIKGLGWSNICQYYELKSLNEARDYLNDNYLRQNLLKITNALLQYKNRKKISEIMDDIDSIKLKSCMTLFKYAANKREYRGIFQKVLDGFFEGKDDIETLKILEIDKDRKPFLTKPIFYNGYNVENIYNSQNNYK